MTSIFIKELSDDAKNPRLINVPHEWPISRHSNCCDSASICVHDGFAYRKIDGFRTLTPLPCRQDFPLISGGVRLRIYRCCEKNIN